MDKIDHINQISVEMAENCLVENLEKAYSLVSQLYENIRNDGFLFAKRRMEMILFRLNVLKYYEVPKRIGVVDQQLYCRQTDEGAAYREEVIRKLNQTFDREQGEILFEKGKSLYLEEKYEEAIGSVKESALQGNPEGAFWYGDMLLKGEGCEKDEFTGCFWLWQASQMGCSEAMVSLGFHYYKGIGVWHSKVRGLYYFALAALQHNLAAIYNIGVSLEQEAVIMGNAALGRTFQRAAEDLAEGPYGRAAYFVDNNAKIILELLAESLIKDEGGV